MRKLRTQTRIPPIVQEGFSNPSIDVEVLWTSPRFQITRSCWRRDRHPAESKRHAPKATLEWMQEGSFRKHVRGDELIGDANTIVLFNAGEDFRVSHPHGSWNRGVSLRLEPDFVRELTESIERSARTTSEQVFARTHAAAEPTGQRILYLMLRHLTSDNRVDALAIEEGAMCLLLKVLHPQNTATFTHSGRIDPRSKTKVLAAKEYLSAHFAGRVQLGDIAEFADCTPWHLAHLFRLHENTSVHRYLTRLRLRHALAQILGGSEELTQAALNNGFCSHSHFGSAFRREFGQSPSGVRRETLTELLSSLGSRTRG